MHIIDCPFLNEAMERKIIVLPHIEIGKNVNYWTMNRNGMERLLILIHGEPFRGNWVGMTWSWHNGTSSNRHLLSILTGQWRSVTMTMGSPKWSQIISAGWCSLNTFNSHFAYLLFIYRVSAGEADACGKVGYCDRLDRIWRYHFWICVEIEHLSKYRFRRDK